MKKAFKIIPVVLIILFLYLLFWPVAIQPTSWIPQKAPKLEGVYQKNTYLASVEKLAKGEGVGPEDVALDSRGRVYAGMQHGHILRFNSDGSNTQVFADIGDKVLGMEFDKKGNLIVCGSGRGLLSVSVDGVVTVLTTEHAGLPFKFVNDVDIARDGTIYFTDSSYKFGFSDLMIDLLEHTPNGRLLAYDPGTKTTSLVLDKLYFANGVALSPDESFILVSETGKYRIIRHWLSGPKKGETEIFIENLPGFPDGISCNGKDTFWVALVSPRIWYVDLILPHPFARKMFIRLPEFMWPKPLNYGFVLGLDKKGKVLYNLQHPSSHVQISSVTEHQGMLYLGSLVEESIGRIALPTKPLSQ